jgi:hypothetical protein
VSPLLVGHGDERIPDAPAYSWTALAIPGLIAGIIEKPAPGSIRHRLVVDT